MGRITPYLIDEIARLRRSFDENGSPTTITVTGIKAKIEDYNGMIRDNNGQEVKGNMLVITEPDENILNEDFILIKKKNGIAYHLPNKEFAIKKINNAAGWFATQKEIYL